MPSEPVPPGHGSAAEPQFLHPISLLFIVGASLRNSIFALIAAVIAIPYPFKPLAFGAILVPIVGSSLLRYFGFRYRLGADDLIVREGILSRNERHIPYLRIQNIDIVQNPIHKMFGVALARVQTASGSRPEATIRVLSLESIEDIRERVFRERAVAGQGEGETGRPAGKPLVSLSVGDLTLFGIINNRGMVLVAAAMGLAAEFGLFEAVTQNIERIANVSIDLASLDGWPWLRIVTLALVGLAVVLFVLRVFSVGIALFKYYGFELTRHGDDLRSTYGLFNTVSATVPRHRIQRLIVRSTPLHRLLGLTSAQIETAGGGNDDEGDAKPRRQWLAPVLDEEKLDALVDEALPQVDRSDLQWQPLARGALRRVFFRACALGGLACLGLTVVFGTEALMLILAVIPLALIHAKLYVRHAGYALTETALIQKKGWWNRRTIVVRFSKMQAVGLRESPFDRRRRMATLQVDTAGSAMASGHGLEMPYLEVDGARALLARLYDEASQTSFRW